MQVVPAQQEQQEQQTPVAVVEQVLDINIMVVLVALAL